ncbi:DUF4365 domain-containing protein [Ancylomarina sp. DW003]|nr:DUF4365 domain-containing protein [Ancylomarina sp. DW003]
MTERDYGIDLYIEIVGKDRKVTGNLIAIQVKGKKEVKFNSKTESVYSGIKRSTINYWNNLPVPVFFIVVCISTQRAFWTNVNMQNREGRFKGKSKTTSLRLKEKFEINDKGLLAFNLVYLREKRWPAVESAIEKSLMSFTSFGPFILLCKRKPQNEICTSTIQYLLLQHYENYTLLSRFLHVKKPIPLPNWYDKHVEQIKSGKAENSFRFTYGLIWEMIKGFANAMNSNKN